MTPYFFVCNANFLSSPHGTNSRNTNRFPFFIIQDADDLHRALQRAA